MELEETKPVDNPNPTKQGRGPFKSVSRLTTWPLGQQKAREREDSVIVQRIST